MPSGVITGVAPERRGSTSSEGSAAGSTSHTRSLSGEEPDYLQAARSRMTKAAPPKPATNPLQFIKVGPCDLYRSAQEQLKRAEEVRKTKEVKKEEQEDWQSNLDNWKSSRRKRVEHIIERCVEVKRLTEEEQERQRRRSKTFNEMMEDRAGRRNSRMPLPIYCEEDNNDLSDLGIGTSSASGKSSLSEDCDNHSLASDGMDLDKNHSDLDNMSSSEIGTRKFGSSANEYDTCTTATISSPEPEEYTYEGAIQSYKSRVISRTQSTDLLSTKINGTNNTTKEKSPDNFTNGNSHLRRTSLGNKIENKLSTFEQRRASSVEFNNADTNKKSLPKVDILKRRELFEKESSPETNGVVGKNAKLNGDLSNTKSLKERLSNLEKLVEDPVTTTKSNILPTEASSLKQRLSSLEKHISESDKSQTRLSNGDLTNVPSLKDRLSNLKANNSSQEKLSGNGVSPGVTQTIKERLSSLDSARNKHVLSSPERETKTNNKQNGFDDMEFREDSSYESHQNSSGRNSSPESGLYDSKRFHRSLDSLDTDDNLHAEKFERIQSSEDICGEGGTGGETDREDSGVHTGDVSSAVSQADEPVDQMSLTLLGTSVNSQDTVIHLDGCISDSPQPDELSSKDESCHAVSHTSVCEDDPPTVDDNTEVFFDKEEEDTVKSLEPDNSIMDALDMAFEAIDTEETPEKVSSLPRVEESLNILKPKKEETLLILPNVPAVKEVVELKNISITRELNETTKRENSLLKDSGDFHKKNSKIESVGFNTKETVEMNKKNSSILKETLELNKKENSKIKVPVETYKKDNLLLKDTIKISKTDGATKKTVPLYENIDLLYCNVGLPTNNDVIGFPLGPPVNMMEPPKEKPPPPPVDDDDGAPLIRLNSTKRIKKEIRNKRSSFLGLEGGEDDSYLEPELKLAPRPDITSFLQEESRVEKMLYRKTLYYDSDLGESRDSGVELDRGQSDDTWSNKQASPDTLSEQHSRQGSEPFTNTSVTSEEDESNKKERDFVDGHENGSNQHYIKVNNFAERQEVMGQQLTDKLKKLEQEKMILEIQRNTEGDKNRSEEDSRIRSLEEQIREQQKKELNERCDESSDDGHFEEVLRVERELLQLEQEELKRQRDNLLFRENQARRGRSLQDINMIQSFPVSVVQEPAYSYAPPIPAGVNYRQSMPDLAMKQTELQHFQVTNSQPSQALPLPAKSNPMIIKKLPPPIPPAKPTRSLEMQERDINVRNSRMPSAEYVNVDTESGVVLRQKAPLVATPATNGVPHHQMSRHTLQALSAAPRSRLIPAADWLQPKRRSDVPQNYDYNQHWLIQEAEQRRIDQLRSNIKKQAQTNPQARSKHLPDAVIQTLTQRVQNMSAGGRPQPPPPPPPAPAIQPAAIPQAAGDSPERMLSVSGKKKCSHCGEELGRGAAMIIESLRLFYHLSCFQCCVCGVRLGDGRLGADVRVRHNQLHCHNCYSSDDGVKFSCV